VSGFWFEKGAPKWGAFFVTCSLQCRNALKIVLLIEWILRR